MIGFISGILREKDFDTITVECGGMGFSIMVTKSCMSNLPNIDEEVKIYTYLHVREDAFSLFGFSSKEEKSLFLELITVSGIGAKSAIQLLSGTSLNGLITAISKRH